MGIFSRGSSRLEASTEASTQTSAPEVRAVLQRCAVHACQPKEARPFTVEGKVVALFFSKYFCQEGRFVCKQLQRMYWHLIKEEEAMDTYPLEVVYVPLDQEPDACDTYCAEMLWFALDFAERDAVGQLADACGLASLDGPSVVFCRP